VLLLILSFFSTSFFNSSLIGPVGFTGAADFTDLGLGKGLPFLDLVTGCLQELVQPRGKEKKKEKKSKTKCDCYNL
jgi:hypothetical protein